MCAVSSSARLVVLGGLVSLTNVGYRPSARFGLIEKTVVRFDGLSDGGGRDTDPAAPLRYAAA